MRKITAILLLLICLHCGKSDRSPADGTSSTSVPAISILANVPPERWRETFLAAYRLKPDWRAIMAIHEVSRIVDGESGPQASVEFSAGQWRIHFGKVDVGTLPKYPDFPDFMNLLNGWAVFRLKQHPFPTSSVKHETGVDGILLSDLMKLLETIDLQWNQGHKDVDSVHRAAEALTWLNLQKFDRMQMGDLIPARAMAAVAVLNAATQTDTKREQCILSYSMGYSRYAEQLARQLSPADPVSQYVLRDSRSLELAAIKPGASLQTKYLALLSISDQGKLQLWSQKAHAWFGDAQSTSLIRPGFETVDFETYELADKSIPVLIAELEGENGKAQASPDSPSLSAFASRLESDLKTRGAQFKGPFLDGDLFADYFHCFLYSSLQVQGYHYLDQLSSADATSEFYSTLSKESPIAAEFQTWYGHLSDWKNGRGNVRLMTRDLTSLPDFGPAPLIRTLEILTKLGSSQFALSTSVRQLIFRADTRPENLISMGNAAYWEIHDLRLAGEFYEASLQNGSFYPSSTIWATFFTRGSQAAIDFLDASPNLKGPDVVSAFSILKTDGSPLAPDLEPEYIRQIKAHPNEYQLRRFYASYLVDQKRYAAALQTLREWLKTYRTSEDDFDYIFACSKLGRVLYLMHRYQEGWDALKPVAASGQITPMIYGSRLLQKLNRESEAEELASEAVNRYPDSADGRGNLATIFWLAEKYDKAAEPLKPTRFPLSSSDWCSVVGTDLAEASTEIGNEKALKGLSALVDNGVNIGGLSCIGSMVYRKEKNVQLAYDMQSLLLSKKPSDMSFILEVYYLLGQLKGKDAASQWLKSRVPASQAGKFKPWSVYERKFGLLWDAVPADGQPHPEETWWLRAIGFALEPDNTHQKELMGYYKNHSTVLYDHMGRYLLDLEKEQDLLHLAKDGVSQSQISYSIAIRAEGAGRWEDASDWYRICLELGMNNDNENQYSRHTLDQWSRYGQGLWRQAQEKIAPSPPS